MYHIHLCSGVIKHIIFIHMDEWENVQYFIHIGGDNTWMENHTNQIT